MSRPFASFRAVLALLALVLSAGASAQDLEPRRWSQLPTDVSFLGVGLGYAWGDILFDPVLQIEDAEFELTTAVIAYVRSFSLFGRSARFDVNVPYSSGTWRGLLQGEPASTRRAGYGDPRFRLSMLLYGGPAQTPQEFATTEQSDTVVGMAISVTAPLGEYYEDRLINLGTNRWTLRPQIGVTHTRGNWTYELTGSAFLFSDNNDFFGGNELESEPLYAVQGHLIYTVRPGLWMSASTAYGSGANPTISGVKGDSETRNWLTALSLGVPIDRSQGLKFTWLRTETREDTGANVDALIMSWSRMF